MNQKQKTAVIIGVFLFAVAIAIGAFFKPMIEADYQTLQNKVATDDLTSQITPSNPDSSVSKMLARIDRLEKHGRLLNGARYLFVLAGLLVTASAFFLKERPQITGFEDEWDDDEWDEEG